MPVVLVVAFLVGETSGGSSAAPTTSAAPGPLTTTVPAPAAGVEKVCDPILAAMPVTLDDGDGTTLTPLVVTPGGPTFLAWGNPLVSLHCGTPRPTWLRTDNDYGQPQQITAPDGYGALWVAMPQSDNRTIWTVIDRAVYFEADLPSDNAAFLTGFSDVIGKALPAICSTPQDGDGPDAKYCGARR